MEEQLRDLHDTFFHRIIAFWPHFWASSHLRALTAGLILFFALLTNMFHLTLSVPATFAKGTVFTIEKGMTLSQISDSLEAEGYIRSALAFKIMVKGLLGDEKSIVAGDYFFESRIGAFRVAQRVVNANFGLKPNRVTIPEGLNRTETAELLASYFENFDKEKFVLDSSEGYLFPDTYFFTPNVTTDKVISVMKENFDRRVSARAEEIKKFEEESGYNLDEIITMASIVETEARQFETRQTIAGVLWKRLETDMPLQVDVSFKYINGKGTAELTGADLDLDSPYNSYKYAGLPPTPISNPGMDSILATISPTKTDYLYFLSDDDGVMHFAASFEEHKKNKIMYLR